MGKTAEGAKTIMAALNTAIEEGFGGLTIARGQNLSVMLSNMGDAFDSLADVIYEEGGIGSALKFVVKQMTDAIVAARVFFQSFASGGIPSSVFEVTGQARVDEINRLIDEIDAKDKSRGKKKRGGAVDSTQRNKDTVVRDLLLGMRTETQGGIDAAAAAAAKAEQDNIDRENKRRITQLADERVEGLKSTVSAMQTAQQKAQETVTFLKSFMGKKDELEKAGLTSDGLADLIKQASDELDKIKKEANETSDTFMQTMAPAIASMAHSFTNDFVNALMEGANALDAFKDLAKNIVSQIIATFLQMAVVNRILNAIFGPTGMNVSGYQPMPTIGTRARGGPVSSGRPYLVGERGPEIFVPHTGGSVLSNRQSMSAGGGIVINQSLNFSTGVQATVRQEVVKMLPMIGDVSKASVLEAASRGGNFRKGLLGT